MIFFFRDFLLNFFLFFFIKRKKTFFWEKNKNIKICLNIKIFYVLFCRYYYVELNKKKIMNFYIKIIYIFNINKIINEY